MEGYRSLESGDLRILEDGSERVTEGFLDGFANLSGAGSIAGLSKLKANGTSALSSTGSVLLAGQGKLFGRLNVSATGSVSFLGKTKARGLFDVNATGSLVVSGLKRLNASVALSGSSVFTSVAGFKYVGAFAKSGTGSFDFTPHYIGKGSYTTFIENPDRILESGDARITENGDTRITDDIVINGSVALLYPQATVIPFDSSVYVKMESDWKYSVIHANVNGQWTLVDKTYQNINGRWKRIN